MRVRVLGAAAGGGFPQWNCGCANCRDARAGVAGLQPRTQESIAVSADGEQWFVLNASPEIRAQIEGFPALHPRAPRQTPIQALVLTNGDMDHVLGLLSLRESHPIVIYATECVRRGFTRGNVLYRTLERFPDQVTWRTLVPDAAVELSGVDGRASGLTLTAVTAPGKPPVHLSGSGSGSGAGDPDENIGVVISDSTTQTRLAYFAAAGGITPAVQRACNGADAVFFDGTFWSSDELIHLGLGTQRAADMAHLPVGPAGGGGSLGTLGKLSARRRVYIHINNTNPMLRTDSPERRAVEAAGWEVAYDGMEFTL